MQKRATWSPFSAFALSIAAVLAFAGCSDLHFVDQKPQATTADDPRENLILTGVKVDITSGSALQREIHGDQAIYSNLRGLLQLSSVKVDTFADQKLASSTHAETGTIYLADQPRLQRRKNDLEFLGDVVHRAPDQNDPTTDSLVLRTDSLRWDGTTEKFRSDSPYEATISPRGQGQLVMRGERFESTRDLRSWTMQYGTVASGSAEEARKKALLAAEDLTRRAEAAEQGSKRPSALLKPAAIRPKSP